MATNYFTDYLNKVFKPESTYDGTNMVDVDREWQYEQRMVQDPQNEWDELMNLGGGQPTYFIGERGVDSPGNFYRPFDEETLTGVEPGTGQIYRNGEFITREQYAPPPISSFLDEEGRFVDPTATSLPTVGDLATDAALIAGGMMINPGERPPKFATQSAVRTPPTGANSPYDAQRAARQAGGPRGPNVRPTGQAFPTASAATREAVESTLHSGTSASARLAQQEAAERMLAKQGVKWVAKRGLSYLIPGVGWVMLGSDLYDLGGAISEKGMLSDYIAANPEEEIIYGP